jgi:thiol-disulfide isomerase/thioredoxin
VVKNLPLFSQTKGAIFERNHNHSDNTCQMKKFISVLAFLILGFSFTISTYGQKEKVPPFRMMMANNKVFMAEDFPLGKPMLIVYFSPECEDCHVFIEGMLNRIGDFKNVSIAMVTYMTGDIVSKYVVKNSLNMYNNIYVGTEGNTLFLKNYYNIIYFPYVVLYNKEGDLIVKYTNKKVDIDDLVSRIKKL